MEIKFNLTFQKRKKVAEKQMKISEETLAPFTHEGAVHYGDIWKLGDHRLMCGDSTYRLDVAKLMEKRKATMVLTDPPYGMKKERKGVLGDNQNRKELLAFGKTWIPISFSNLSDNGSWYCFGSSESIMDIYSHIIKPMILDEKATFRNLLTWDKVCAQGQMCGGVRKFSTADEKILFVVKGVSGLNDKSRHFIEAYEPIRAYLSDEQKKVKAATGLSTYQICGNYMGRHYFTKSQFQLPKKDAYERLQSIGKDCGAFQKPWEYLKEDYDKALDSSVVFFDNTHDNMNSVWHFNRVVNGSAEYKDAGGHPTVKPIKLCERAIKSSAREGDIVLDLFGGSGSVLLACENTGRHCRMMELSPKWCEVIINRWVRLTGRKAELIKRIKEVDGEEQ